MKLTRYRADSPPVWAGDPIEKEPTMIESRPHLVRIKGGVRVLRLAAIGGHIYPLRYDVPRDRAWCRRCGCTDIYGCAGGCGWVDVGHTLCSRCLERGMLL